MWFSCLLLVLLFFNPNKCRCLNIALLACVCKGCKMSNDMIGGKIQKWCLPYFSSLCIIKLLAQERFYVTLNSKISQGSFWSDWNVKWGARPNIYNLFGFSPSGLLLTFQRHHPNRIFLFLLYRALSFPSSRICWVQLFPLSSTKCLNLDN